MIRVLLACVVLVSLNPVLAKEKAGVYKIEVLNKWGEAKVEFHFYVARSADIQNLTLGDVLLDQIVIYDARGKTKQIIDYSEANQDLWFGRFRRLFDKQDQKLRKVAKNLNPVSTRGYLILLLDCKLECVVVPIKQLGPIRTKHPDFYQIISERSRQVCHPVEALVYTIA